MQKPPRIVLIAVEDVVNKIAFGKKEYRLWPHLGLLFVGTIADQEGWEVILYDELIQGYINLEEVIQPGDLVGLSLVVTGMERGIEIAKKSKNLGAKYVIAGNDAAIFRTNQLLQFPDHPIDAVFTTNDLSAIRKFFRQIQSAELDKLEIHGVAINQISINPSNERQVLETEFKSSSRRMPNTHNLKDAFIVPKFNLFGDEYWDIIWQNYRAIFGHKHNHPKNIKNATAFFAQGCTRCATNVVCAYCAIADVAKIQLPSADYLKKTLNAYESFGINCVFNVIDSIFEMKDIVETLKNLDAFFSEGISLYGRALGVAYYPKLIDEWLSLSGGRLLINIGLDSFCESVLKNINKGSKVVHNIQAVENIAQSGAHLHCSFIFGSPGETHDSCLKTLEFFEWMREVLSSQLDQCELDIFWLNYGAPASRVFHDYNYARRLAGLANKTISLKQWKQCFYDHRNNLTVPWVCQLAWYNYFTSITIEEAQEYILHITNIMARHDQSVPGRSNAFKPRMII